MNKGDEKAVTIIARFSDQTEEKKRIRSFETNAF